MKGDTVATKKGMPANRKTRAVSRINQAENKLNSGNSRLHINAFLIKYILCEIAAKEMVVGYKATTKDPVKYEDVKMIFQTLKAACNSYGLGLPDDLIKRLFGAEKINGCRSAKKIRDSLVHSMTKQNISEVDGNYTQLIADMDAFLDAVRH